MKLQLFLFLLLSLSLEQVSAQPIAKIEQKLIRHLEKIDSLTMLHGPDAPIDLSDSIEREDSLLGQRLQALTSGNVASLTYAFDRLQRNGMIIATSKDGHLRIYSWDAETGGTAHIFNNVYQYRIGNKLYSNFVADGDFYCSDIYTFDFGDHRYYLCQNHAITATLQCYESIEALTLTNATISDTAARIIRTRSGLTNTLGFAYTLDNHVPDGNLIHYEVATKTIWFPVVLAEGRVTKKRITYRLSGKYFEKVKD